MADIFNGVKTNNTDEIQEALNNDPLCINSQDEFGRIPAMYPVMRGNFQMLEFLAKQPGFDANIEDHEGNALIEYSFWCADIEMARYAYSLMYPAPEPRPKLTLVPKI